MKRGIWRARLEANRQRPRPVYIRQRWRRPAPVIRADGLQCVEWNGMEWTGSLRGRQWVDDAKRTARRSFVLMRRDTCRCRQPLPAPRAVLWECMATDRWKDYRRQDKFRRQRRRERGEGDHTAVIADCCSLPLMTLCHVPTQSTNNSYSPHYGTRCCLLSLLQSVRRLRQNRTVKYRNNVTQLFAPTIISLYFISIKNGAIIQKTPQFK